MDTEAVGTEAVDTEAVDTEGRPTGLRNTLAEQLCSCCLYGYTLKLQMTRAHGT